MADTNMQDMLQSLLSALNEESPRSENGGEAAAESFTTEENSSGGEFDFNGFFENIDIDMIMKIGEIFALFSRADKNTDLLRALKPHLRDENREKIDTAIKILKVAALLPYLRESGFMDKLF